MIFGFILIYFANSSWDCELLYLFAIFVQIIIFYFFLESGHKYESILF